MGQNPTRHGSADRTSSDASVVEGVPTLADELRAKDVRAVERLRAECADCTELYRSADLYVPHSGTGGPELCADCLEARFPATE